MKTTAIRGNIGIWTYYIATLSFKEVSEFIREVNDELHKSKTLSDLLQRSLTSNYQNISHYINTQDERFFNSLILGVYDGAPQWQEVRLDYSDGSEFYDLGILELSGEEKIFPIDGQHRVEGIKDALNNNPKLANEKMPVIFVSHKKDEAGMERSRRMFSTLNRYAKPVSLRDIIALDEDDAVAIATRSLIEKHELFYDSRLLNSKNKSIPRSNTTSFTSIITFYQCNNELLVLYLENKEIRDRNNKKLKGSSKLREYITRRPPDDQINEFIGLCFEFWDSFSKNITDVNKYLSATEVDSSKFRNTDGGNFLFRPIALKEFVKAMRIIVSETGIPFDEVLRNANNLPFDINTSLWRKVLWSYRGKKMIVSNATVVCKLIIYLYDKRLLNDEDINKLNSKLPEIYEMDIDAIYSEILNEYLNEEA